MRRGARQPLVLMYTLTGTHVYTLGGRKSWVVSGKNTSFSPLTDLDLLTYVAGEDNDDGS